MTNPPKHRGRSAAWAGRPWLTTLSWLAVAAAVFFAGLKLGVQTVLPGPSSKQALLANQGENFAIAAGIPPRDQLILMIDGGTTKYDSPQFAAARDSLWNLLRQAGGESPLLRNLQTAGHSVADDEQFLSKDRTKLLLAAETAARVDGSSAALKDLQPTLDGWSAAHSGFSLYWLGKGFGDAEIFKLINSDLDRSLIFTLPLSMAVLLWTFGSAVSAVLPLIVALVSLAASLGVTALFSHCVAPVSATAEQLVVLLVLAIGVDYSLFIVSRMREEVRRGSSYPQAIEIAGKSAGRAVILSGFTVALSLCGLLLMHDSLLTSMAAVSIAAVIITVFGCTAVLPALLLLLAEKIEIGGFSSAGQEEAKRPHPLLHISVKFPLPVLLTGGVLLLGLCSYAFELKLGSTVQPETLPRSMQIARARDAILASFPDTFGADLSLILHGSDLEELESNGVVQALIDQASQLPSLHGPTRTDVSDDAQTERYNFTVLGSINDPLVRRSVNELREKLIPPALNNSATRGYLSGTVPFAVDDELRYGGRTPHVYGAVLGVSFLFLLAAFRSMVIPVKTVVLNLLSTGASFGVLVLIFQGAAGDLAPHGLNYGVIESFVPPLLFAILFGLSMDYHVFLLSRVKEEVDNGKSTAAAVETAIATTSRTITGAALIMVAVFSIIGTLELPVMKQLGIGLAFAVFLDATIVRSFLLPSSLVLLGDWNWYLPRWIEKLLRAGLREDGTERAKRQQ